MRESLQVLRGHTDALWRRGSLDFLRHPGQQVIADAIAATSALTYYIDVARKFGKSTELVMQAWETCLRQPNQRVWYVTAFGNDAEEIAVDIIMQLLEGDPETGERKCPEDCRPQYKVATRTWQFLNGSTIKFKGVNNKRARFRRGPRVHLFLGDEITTWDDANYVIKDVAMPMTITTGGRIILAGTPPRSPGHDAAILKQECEEKGAYIKFTIHDNPMLSAATIARYCEESGGEESTTWKREYLCEWITDEKYSVIPEWHAASQDSTRPVVLSWKNPPYYDRYVSMDPAVTRDKTGILFGYYDFKNDRDVIVRELLLSRSKANTYQIADAIKAVEAELWGTWVKKDGKWVKGEGEEPYMRVSDTELRLIVDLCELHGLAFVPAEKQDSRAGINLMRTRVSERRYAIDPSCKQLQQQMRNAIYNERGTDMARSDIDAHFDLVAALKYFSRAIQRTHNPYPAGWELTSSGLYITAKGRAIIEREQAGRNLASGLMGKKLSGR